jgi:hypothetical protein
MLYVQIAHGMYSCWAVVLPRYGKTRQECRVMLALGAAVICILYDDHTISVPCLTRQGSLSSEAYTRGYIASLALTVSMAEAGPMHIYIQPIACALRQPLQYHTVHDAPCLPR